MDTIGPGPNNLIDNGFQICASFRIREDVHGLILSADAVLISVQHEAKQTMKGGLTMPCKRSRDHNLQRERTERVSSVAMTQKDQSLLGELPPSSRVSSAR